MPKKRKTSLGRKTAGAKKVNSNAGQKPAEGWFLSKWVYNFWTAKILNAYQVISNITSQEVVNFPKTGAKSSKP